MGSRYETPEPAAPFAHQLSGYVVKRKFRSVLAQVNIDSLFIAQSEREAGIESHAPSNAMEIHFTNFNILLLGDKFMVPNLRVRAAAGVMVIPIGLPGL